MVMLEYKHNTELVGVYINCVNYRNNEQYIITNEGVEDITPIFIKYFVL